jgi:L-serine dehydratase
MTAESSLFDIVGPVMVGPSSSHTAGAVRLGLLAKQLAGGVLKHVECVLYNSFAQTYRGHGTDKGLAAGLMGYSVQDDRIRTALELAKTSGLTLAFTPWSKPNHYSPNTVVFEITLGNGTHATVVGHSVGGGRVYVSRFNQYSVSLKGEAPTLILFYKDQPGMIWQVTKILAEQQINIASLMCSRRQRGVEAFMSIQLDTPLTPEIVVTVAQIPEVYTVRHLDKITD